MRDIGYRKPGDGEDREHDPALVDTVALAVAKLLDENERLAAELGIAEDLVAAGITKRDKLRAELRKLRAELDEAVRRECTALCTDVEHERDQLNIALTEAKRQRDIAERELFDANRKLAEINAAVVELAPAPNLAAASSSLADDATIADRDRYHEVADILAAKVAELAGIDIGEHSNANNPWQNAADALDRMIAATAPSQAAVSEAVVHAEESGEDLGDSDTINLPSLAKVVKTGTTVWEPLRSAEVAVLEAAEALADIERDRSAATEDSSIWLESQKKRAVDLIWAVDSRRQIAKSSVKTADHLAVGTDKLAPAAKARPARESLAELKRMNTIANARITVIRAATACAGDLRNAGYRLSDNARSLIVAVDALIAAESTADATCGSCGGSRWVDDGNWQPEQHELRAGRKPGAGRIPCGACNHGGWNVDDGQSTADMQKPPPDGEGSGFLAGAEDPASVDPSAVALAQVISPGFLAGTRCYGEQANDSTDGRSTADGPEQTDEPARAVDVRDCGCIYGPGRQLQVCGTRHQVINFTSIEALP